MKPYKGIIKIKCESKKGCPRKLKDNVAAGCIDCPEAVRQVLDLEGKVLSEYKAPANRPGKKVKK